MNAASSAIENSVSNINVRKVRPQFERFAKQVAWIVWTAFDVK
jgi:hypothetical protein